MVNFPVIQWFDKDTVKHLRIPFSFFLLPVFMFALSQAYRVNWINAALTFLILHLLVFPSGNGYNSYQDRDDTSIGGIKHPPKITKNLYYVTLMFDVAAIILASVVSNVFAVMLLVYIIMSRMYSYRGIRLKKYAVGGFLTVFIFQGGYVYLMSLVAVTSAPVRELITTGNLICMVVSSLFIGSMYPITQIYQHDADKSDGVKSISCLLGYRGTFYFAGSLFFVATAMLLYYFGISNQSLARILFMLLILPVVVYLSRWFSMVRQNSAHASFENTMKANFLSSGSMNLFFLILIINNRLAPL